MAKKVDLTGIKFGFLTVLFKAPSDKGGISYWNCSCDCGGNKTVSLSSLRAGSVRSCGCIARKGFKDKTEQEKNGLVLQKYIGSNKYKCSMYEVSCRCGKIFIAEGNDILSEKIRSCGCGVIRAIENRANYQESIINNLFRDYFHKAKLRGYVFELNIQKFTELIKDKCQYCGIESSNIKTTKNTLKGNITLSYNGIDRKNNDLGYTTDNCVTACRICNQAKHQMTEEYFKIWLERLFAFKENKEGIWNGR